MAFVGAVGALEAAAFRMPKQGFVSNDVAARHHHWKILIRGLLFGYRADKDRMELICRRKGNLNLCKDCEYMSVVSQHYGGLQGVRSGSSTRYASPS